MLLDQTALEDQTLEFAVGDDVLEVVYVLNHAPNLFGVVVLGAEVLADAVFQFFRFADIDDLALLVLHDIHAGLQWQRHRLLAKLFHLRIHGLSLMHALGGHVLDRKLQHRAPCAVLLDIALGHFPGWKIFVAQKAEFLCFLIFIRDLAQPAEGDHALPVIRPAVVRQLLLFRDAERGFIMLSRGFDLVSRESGMEVDTAAIVDKIQRHGVGVVHIAEHCQNPAGILAQYPFTFFLR